MGEGRARARRVRRLGVAAACACALIGLPGLSGPSGTGRAVAADPALDAYGGWAGTTEVATGFFRTQQVDGRWWLIDPEGHPFFSNGINHVVPEGTPDRNGHAAYHEAILAKHGTEEAWADAQVERFDRWGTNTLGGWSDKIERGVGDRDLITTLQEAGGSLQLSRPLGLDDRGFWIHLERHDGRRLDQLDIETRAVGREIPHDASCDPFARHIDARHAGFVHESDLVSGAQIGQTDQLSIGELGGTVERHDRVARQRKTQRLLLRGKRHPDHSLGRVDAVDQSRRLGGPPRGEGIDHRLVAIGLPGVLQAITRTKVGESNRPRTL